MQLSLPPNLIVVASLVCGLIPFSIIGTGASREDSLPLSVEGQVHRLIEEATAVENLVQMYIGWQPWA